jgi:hypothetical protein
MKNKNTNINFALPYQDPDIQKLAQDRLSPNNSLNSISTKDSCSISTDFANAGPGTNRISEGRALLTEIGTDNVGSVKESLKNGDYLTSTNYSTNVNLKELVAIKSYENAELFKGTILKENRNQSGVYR